MRRLRKNASHENHERWLVSYADFITLLFAFFVVMFASSQTDKARAQQVSDSVREALQDGGVRAMVREVLGGAKGEAGKGNALLRGPGGARADIAEASEVPELAQSMELLSKELRPEIEAGDLQLRLEPRGLVISLRQAAFFPSGEDTIDPATYPTLGKIASTIGRLPNPVRLEGHTDSIPIHTARFRSNWELSAARSIAMLQLLTSRFELPQERFGVAGFAANAPMDSNGTEEGRAHNRRVDIVILNRYGLLDQPSAARRLASGKERPSSF